MKNLIFLFCFFIPFASSAQLPGGSTLIERVAREEGKLGINYEKYKLKNGLTLIVHEDHSNPIVHVEVFYHAGSTRDPKGRSGFAHFFEHMMFTGSEHVKPGELNKTVIDAGGICNANTNFDYTVYYETIPPNYLETILWMEADRMGFFHDSISLKKFENQRATVINERGQNYDNKPYGLINEKINAAIYPSGHPYSTSTIGSIVDIKNARLDEIKQFFLRWYGPNNATLVVAGDIDSKRGCGRHRKIFWIYISRP